MYELKVPDLGEDTDDITLVCWIKSLGQEVSSDEDIVELVTDKAVFCVPAGSSGRINKLLVKEGDKVKTGQIIAVIE